MKKIFKSLAIAICLMTTLTIIIIFSENAYAESPWYVAPGGSNGNSCLTPALPCATINGAIEKASSGDTVYIAEGIYTANTGEEVVLIDKSVMLSGGWNTVFTSQTGMSTVDGGGMRQVIVVTSSVTTTIEYVVAQNGYADAGGGGISNSGILSLNDSVVAGNTGEYYGGGINNEGILTLESSTVAGNVTHNGGDGGGIYNTSGTLVINNSTISDNMGAGSGGGIYNYDGILTLNNSAIFSNTAVHSSGGIFNYSGTLTLDYTAINNNSAAGGGGMSNHFGEVSLNYSTINNNISQFDGGIINGGTLTLNYSSISGNTASSNYGGISNAYGTVTLNNSTVSGNMAGPYGSGTSGIYNFSGDIILNNSTISYNTGSGIANYGTLTLNNTTVSNNTAGGISNVYGTVTMQNSILADNTGIAGPDCNGTINSAGYNLIGNTSDCTFTDTVGDLTNVDARLGSFLDNGGATLTHALLPDSPAINAGNPGGCLDAGGILTTDQRELARFDRCDMGAYELQPIGYSTQTVSPTSAFHGDQLTYNITLMNAGEISLTNILMTDTLPSALLYVENSLTATGGNYGYDKGTINWSGSLDASELVTITFKAIINQTFPLGTNTDIINTVKIRNGTDILTRIATVNIPTAQIFLPLALTPWPGISGLVYLNGTPIADVHLELRFFDGVSFSSIASTSTGADGRYSFIGIPSLEPGQTYYVRYRNINGTPGRLWLWGTRTLTSYTAGSHVTIGNFDIADIILITPTPGTTVALPYTFQWIPRPTTPTDTYEFNLYDPNDLNPYMYTDPPLGYIGSFTLNGFPPGFTSGTPYIWEVWVYSPDGGFGISYAAWSVIFSDSGLSDIDTLALLSEKMPYNIDYLPRNSNKPR